MFPQETKDCHFTIITLVWPSSILVARESTITTPVYINAFLNIKQRFHCCSSDVQLSY